MNPPFIPPRHVAIGDAAWFAATTPRAIRHYEQIGLLPEPERGSDGRRRYTYETMIRLLWIRKMAGAGLALDDIAEAFASDPRSDDDDVVLGVLDRLESELDKQEAALRRKRQAVQQMRSRGSRLGLLDDFVARHLEGVPKSRLSRADLDTLVVTERILGPLGAAIHAGRYLALAADPRLRDKSDRIDAAEEALDDTVSVDDPRVARVAAERYAFEKELHSFIDESGQAERDEALFELWMQRETETDADSAPGSGRRSMSAFEALSRLPYDFSPARLRCMEIVERLAAEEAAASS